MHNDTGGALGGNRAEPFKSHDQPCGCERSVIILIFRLNSPLAAVFELSVCTGLITVVFVSTISMTKPLTHKEILEHSKDRLKRFWCLPVIMIVAAVSLLFLKIPRNVAPAISVVQFDTRHVMWNLRQLDLFGQIIIIIAGALGVAILFKENKKNGR